MANASTGKECLEHAGDNNEARADLDHIMKDLPENQAGEGRHKCPYCAYIKGLDDGYDKAMRECEAKKGGEE